MGTGKEVESESEGGKRKQLSRKLKLVTAAVLVCGNFTFGCAFNTYGPALTSLQNKYGTDDASISRVFIILNTCYMIGALSGGFIFNYVNRQLACILLLAIQASMTLLTPYCPTVELFFGSAAILGLALGGYDTAQFVWMMEMMQEECPPYVQTQHFSYAVGTSLASLIMAPFLDPKDPDPEVKYGERLYIPYTIVGSLVLVTMTLQVLLFIFLRYRPPPPEVAEASPGEVSQLNPRSSGKELRLGSYLGNWTLPKFRIFVLAFIFYGLYPAMEWSAFQFFPKFGQNSELALSESMSSYVFSGMTTAFAVGRGIAIIIVFKVPAQLILLGNLILVVVANILLTGWAGKSIGVLWTCSIIFGLGFSSIFGSVSAYMERYLNFTNFIGSMMIVGGSGMAALFPGVVGNSNEENPIILSYTSWFSIACLIVSMSSLSYLTHRDKTRY